MLFYLCNGSTLCGTQADARALDKDFVQLEVPVDKAGLMAFVNELYAREAPAPTTEIIVPVPHLPPPVPYSIKTSEIDKVFQNLPIGHQLTLASLALEKARDVLPC